MNPICKIYAYLSNTFYLFGKQAIATIANYLNASTSSGVNGIFFPKRRAPVSVIK